jgi:3-deoxy-manno-octulosonate cytidylyltransferase (CMP-KDO synthetase)
MTVAIIPARFAASRFPGKPLALISGKPMVEHVFARCREAGCFESIYVATDDVRIAAAVEKFGGKPVMTSSQCQSGSDRVAEAARSLSLSGDIVICNIQGDEPAVHPETLRTLVTGASAG